MKITKVEALYLRQPEVKDQCDSGQDAIIVRVETDAGITGLGEVDSAPLAIQGVIDGPYSHSITSGLAHLLIGEDPFATEYLWYKMVKANSYCARRGILMHAISGIDLALWDIKGKALGQPVWKLLGGGFHDKIRCYASTLFGRTPEETETIGRRLVDQGFGAVKFGWHPMGESRAMDEALVRCARRGVGSTADLMIDAGLVWDAKTALQRANAFAAEDIFWLEEPLRENDYVGYGKLASSTPVRIAAGEHESDRQSYQNLMDLGQIDVVQVDLTRCGGFTEAMKIASLAYDRGLPVANHGFSTYLNVAAALHWLNAVPNALICEFVAQEATNLREQITRQKLRAVDGFLSVPQEPGLGIDLDEDAVSRLRIL